MRNLSLCAGAALALLVGGQALAAENSNRVEAKATPDQAWALIGDFCGIKNWHPAIATCELSEMDGAKIRTLTAKDGAKFVEKLVKWDDAGRSYTYAILESPLPVEKYVSTLKVEEDDEPGKVAIIWSSSFEPKGVSETDARKVVADIYVAGLLALKNTLKGK
ncbi:SRPBCC family protein [Oleomonas cavernae]|uniref:SRPBCC family protein n=1 Tax=Oleomonas cavernae TaxID=2320859 RepID=A0A418VTV4_9PROT|nr:SRPBCC family protein [Oleomonas cavernae]RJF80577.1 SRPBCC family protein [Oleomonas cavernae]